MPEYALISLSMPQHGRILLNDPNIPENALINCSDYARVLSMPRYGCNNIISVTNVIILEFLSGRFVNQGSVLPFYIF